MIKNITNKMNKIGVTKASDADRHGDIYLITVDPGVPNGQKCIIIYKNPIKGYF